jgi:hypothetical protein
MLRGCYRKNVHIQHQQYLPYVSVRALPKTLEYFVLAKAAHGVTHMLHEPEERAEQRFTCAYRSLRSWRLAAALYIATRTRAPQKSIIDKRHHGALPLPPLPRSCSATGSEKRTRPGWEGGGEFSKLKSSASGKDERLRADRSLNSPFHFLNFCVSWVRVLHVL